MRLCLVDTASSLGTGINEKISIFVKILTGKDDCYYLTKESFIKDLSNDRFWGCYYSLINKFNSFKTYLKS